MMKSHKLKLLQLVLERKRILFGKFSPTVTKSLKIKAWNEIAVIMKEDGATFKDALDLRDNHFSNLKRCCTRKLDKAAKTGEGQGDELDDLDNLVLKIIGKESGRVKALSIEDTPIVFEDDPEVEALLSQPTKKTPPC